MSNAHRGRSGDLTTDALDIANSLFIKRVVMPFGGPMLDQDEERQSLYEFILRHLPSYDAERGAVSTWVYMTFRFWQRDRALVREARRNETLFDPLPPDAGRQRGDSLSDSELLGVRVMSLPEPEPPEHDLGERATELLGQLPERMREPVADHLAYGASLTATAEIHGITARTVSRYVKHARQLWLSAA